MKSLKAALGLKNVPEPTVKQKLNQYTPPAQVSAKEKNVLRKPDAVPELNEEEQRRQLNTSTEYIQQVRELIREKYRLDVYVWSRRSTLESNRNKLMESCKQSDEIMDKIRAIVGDWEKQSFTVEEWEIAKQIQQRIGKRVKEMSWQERPPWNRSPSAI